MLHETSQIWRKANKPILFFKIKPAVFLTWGAFLFIQNWWIFGINLMLTLLFAVASFLRVPPIMVCRYVHHFMLGRRKIYRLWWKR